MRENHMEAEMDDLDPTEAFIDPETEYADVIQDSDQASNQQTSQISAYAEHRYEAQGQPLYSVAFHPSDHGTVLSGGGDEVAMLWSSSDQKLLEPKFKDTIIYVGFTPSGDLASAVSMDGSVNVWNTSTYDLVNSTETGEDVQWASIHNAGNVIAAGTASGNLWLYNLSAGVVMAVCAGGHQAAINCGQVGRSIVTGATDGTVVSWNVRASAPAWKIDRPASINALATSQERDVVLVGDERGHLGIAKLATGDVKTTVSSHEGSIETIALTEENTWFITGGLDQKAKIWDLPTSSIRQTVPHEAAVIQSVWHRTISHMFVTGTDGGEVLGWDSRDPREPVREFEGHSAPILDLKVSNDGKRLVTAGDDGQCLVFEMV